MRRAIPGRSAPRRCAMRSCPGCRAGSVWSAPRRSTCCPRSAPRSWSPRCPRSSGWVPATPWWSRSWRTRPTRWAPGWRGATSSRPTRRPPLVRRGPPLVWVNSPANPTGRVLGVEHLRKVVEWGRSRGALVVSDECYLEYGWDVSPVSVLHPDVCAGLLRRRAVGALAVQAVQPGRLPVGVRGRRRRRRRRAARGAPAQRLDDARSGTGRGRRSPRRRRARGGAAGAVSRPPSGAAYGAGGRGVPDSTTPRRRCTCGPPGGSRAGTRWTGWPIGESWSRRAASTGVPEPSTCGSR